MLKLITMTAIIFIHCLTKSLCLSGGIVGRNLYFKLVKHKTSNTLKKSSFTIIDRAILTVDGFDKVKKTPEQQAALLGQSESTLYNYLRRIAAISLHFGKPTG
jgi:hypothetical protein